MDTVKTALAAPRQDGNVQSFDPGDLTVPQGHSSAWSGAALRDVATARVCLEQDVDVAADRGLQVIGAGLPRTGSSSMKAALERLGFGPCHHMFEIVDNPEQVDRWLSVVAGEDVDWDHVLAGYRSTQDWPSAHFWRELSTAYPDAKVVLTVREPQEWYRSFVELTAGKAPSGNDATENSAAPEDGIATTMNRMRPVRGMIARATFGVELQPGEAVDRDVALAAYQRHLERVQSEVPADRLLVFDVREGWAPLCDFLGVPTPENEPFPHLNDSAFLQEVVAEAATRGRIPSPFR